MLKEEEQLADRRPPLPPKCHVRSELDEQRNSNLLSFEIAPRTSAVVIIKEKIVNAEHDTEEESLAPDRVMTIASR